MKVSRASSVVFAGLLTCALSASAADPLKLPAIKLPDPEPLIPNCADPAADHFLSLDMWARPPAGSTPVSAVHAYLTPDNIFHWPLVMRVRNLGDQPFVGKPGKQRAIVTEDDVIAKTKDRQVGEQKFDRIDPRGGLLVHFEFTAPRAAIESKRFHRIYTLKLEFDSDQKALESKFGDCHPKNNSYFVEIDGSRKGWFFAN